MWTPCVVAENNLMMKGIHKRSNKMNTKKWCTLGRYNNPHAERNSARKYSNNNILFKGRKRLTVRKTTKKTWWHSWSLISDNIHMIEVGRQFRRLGLTGFKTPTEIPTLAYLRGRSKRTGTPPGWRCWWPRCRSPCGRTPWAPQILGVKRRVQLTVVLYLTAPNI